MVLFGKDIEMWRLLQAPRALPKSTKARTGARTGRCATRPPTTVYAGVEGTQNAVLRSTDGGLNWTGVLTDPLASRPFLAVDPPNTVYAIDKLERTVYSSTVDGNPGTWNQTAASPNGWFANDLAIELPSYLYAAMGGKINQASTRATTTVTVGQ